MYEYAPISQLSMDNGKWTMIGIQNSKSIGSADAFIVNCQFSIVNLNPRKVYV